VLTVTTPDTDFEFLARHLDDLEVDVLESLGESASGTLDTDTTALDVNSDYSDVATVIVRKKGRPLYYSQTIHTTVRNNDIPLLHDVLHFDC
jgi:hypothetical protein